MSTRQKHTASLFSALALGLCLLVPALAQGPGGGPPPAPGGKGAVGRISAVSATSITVCSREGDLTTFTLASSATITLDGQAAPAGGLKAGEFAAVTSTDGTTATAVDAHSHRPPPGHGPPGGRISAVSATSLTLKTRRGDTKTYTLTSSTTYTKDDQTATASDLAVGQFVHVRSADGTTATAVDAHTGPPPGGGQGGPPPDGEGPPPDGQGPPPDGQGPPPDGQGPPPGQ